MATSPSIPIAWQYVYTKLWSCTCIIRTPHKHNQKAYKKTTISIITISHLGASYATQPTAKLLKAIAMATPTPAPTDAHTEFNLYFHLYIMYIHHHHKQQKNPPKKISSLCSDRSLHAKQLLQQETGLKINEGKRSRCRVCPYCLDHRPPNSIPHSSSKKNQHPAHIRKTRS